MSGLSLAQIGALVGDPGRANMLAALLDGRALTATELAAMARVAPATASGHLAKLVAGGMLRVARQGRHRYYRLASAAIAYMLEGIIVVANDAAPDAGRRATPRIDPRLRLARTCYDHLAGRLGVALADALVAKGVVVLGDEAGEVTAGGRAWLETFGVVPEPLTKTRRLFCRPCLDWSERRPHLAGRLGAALCQCCIDRGWIRRDRDSRAVTITPEGRRGLAETFAVTLP